MTRHEELLKQMTAQCRAEVPGGRRAWPKSIKDRVLELGRLGMGSTAIAEKTGLTYFTIHSWKKQDGDFRAIAIATPVNTLAVDAVATVTVTTGKGLKIAGLTFEQAPVAIERLRLVFT